MIHRGLDAESLEMVLGTFRAVAARRLSQDVRLELDGQHRFPTEVVEELLGPDVGLHLVFIPEDAGGIGGGAYDLFRVSEEMARVDLGVATAFLAVALGIDPIIVGGTEEQRQHWLGRVAEEGLMVAYGVTEPAVGSNVTGIQTAATPVPGPDGTPRAYRLNGTKQFITNGGVAQLYTILARTPGGPSFFVVERDRPGLEPGPDEHKHGIRASNTTQVVLDDVEVPADQLLGLEEGQGLVQAGRVFGFTRLMVAAFGLGAGEEALERVIRYALEREQFGGPLFDKQGYTHTLIVPHFARLEAARAFCEQTARRLDEGGDDLHVEGSVAKLFATEAGNAAADAAIQGHGGYGYTNEYEVEKIRRDVRITTIYEGTSEIQKSIIGTFRWRQQVKSKGGFYQEMASRIRKAGGEEAAALAAEALGATYLTAHAHRLPRQQWILFELARLSAEVETAAAFAIKAAAPEDQLLAATARLHCGAAARDVATTGARLLRASGTMSRDEIEAWKRDTRHADLLATAEGELALMDEVAQAIRER